MSIESLTGVFPCPEDGCEKVFPSAQALQGHVMHHFKKPNVKIPCPECGAMYFSGTGMSQHRKARHGVRNGQPAQPAEANTGITQSLDTVVVGRPETPAPKRGRPAKNRIDLDWTTDDIFQTVITALWPGGNIPVDAVLPLIQWRETTREFLEKVRSE